MYAEPPAQNDKMDDWTTFVCIELAPGNNHNQATHTAHTREPISTHDSSKDAVWRKEVPSKQVLFRKFDF